MVTALRTDTVLAGLLSCVLALAGCGGTGQRGPDPSAVGGPINVFAAASLTEAFTRIGKDFEAAHPGTKVTFNFGGSATLAAQINQAAPVDVFASASPASMTAVTSAGSASGTPLTFARNQLVIAVPNGNPHGITALADLARPGLKIALCAEQVPCGAAAKMAIQAAGITLTPVTLELDVRAALGKVRLGDADAALVYRTDVIAAATSIDGIEFSESRGAINDYSIVMLEATRNATTATAFIEFVLSPRGQAVLADAGFQAP